MDANHVSRFLEKLGCSKIRESSTWVKASCPLAPWRHSGGEDKNPSFAVAIDLDNHSGVRCHTCNFRGNLTTLLTALRWYTKKTYDPLFTMLLEHDQISDKVFKERLASIPDEPRPWREVAGVTVAPSLQPSLALGKELDVFLPESTLDKFRTITDEAWEWFEQRGLGVAAVKEWELGWHPGVRRISVPIRDTKGRLVSVSGRAVDKGVHPKFLHSKGFRRNYYLYGENRSDVGGVGYLVEGFFDVIGLWQRGYRNAYCFMGANLSQFQALKVSQMCSEVVIIPDGDEAGTKISHDVYKAISPLMWKTRIVDVPEGLDPDQLSREFLLENLGPPQC